MTTSKPDIDRHGIYSQAQAARILGVDRHTIARWEKDPRFPLEGFTRAGGRGKCYLGVKILAMWLAR